MTDHLTIHCAKVPSDTLEVAVVDKFVVFCSDDLAHAITVALNRQSAQELYDLLGEFLADDQR